MGPQTSHPAKGEYGRREWKHRHRAPTCHSVGFDWSQTARRGFL